MRVAVVGSGVAGLGAAWALSKVHEVTLFDAEDRVGGHANTVEVDDRGRSVPVDTGFIVYNPPTYPNLVAWFDEMGAPSEPSDMSFGVSADGGGFEYQARALGLLAQPRSLASPAYRGMIGDIVRFCREAPAAGPRETVGGFLDARGYGATFRDGFLLPMIACIWSSRLTSMLDYPMSTLSRFLANHGLLDLGRRPRWRTVSGGSRSYVERAAASATRLLLGDPVTTLRRGGAGIELATASGAVIAADQVVFATHADTTLRILGPEATPPERGVLDAFGFQRNVAVLHRDPALMPRRRRVWSSWNYLTEGRIGDAADERVSLSYWMNRLQNLETADPVIVTLNPHREPKGWSRAFTYDHPMFNEATVRAQRELATIQGVARTWFAGAWTGYGFHEDGLRSGLAVAAALGARAPWTGAPRGIRDLPPPAEVEAVIDAGELEPV